jgi:hypothetical protein
VTSYLRAGIAASVIATFASGIAVGQDPIAEPEYVGDIVALDGESATPLEKQRSSNRARAGALRARASNEIEGVASPVRLSAQPLRFIVRHETNAVNPSQVINIFRMDVNDRRETRVIETGSTGAFSSQSMDIDFLAFDSERYGDSSYLITLRDVLDPGEYAITLDGSRDVFNLFGVD